jgi:hypothetical protein
MEIRQRVNLNGPVLRDHQVLVAKIVKLKVQEM